MYFFGEEVTFPVDWFVVYCGVPVVGSSELPPFRVHVEATIDAGGDPVGEDERVFFHVRYGVVPVDSEQCPVLGCGDEFTFFGDPFSDTFFGGDADRVGVFDGSGDGVADGDFRVFDWCGVVVVRLDEVGQFGSPSRGW